MQNDNNAGSIKEKIKTLSKRGMLVDEDKAQHHLESISYYRLVAYVVPFETKSSGYEDGKDLIDQNFDDVINLYEFDRKFRLHILDAVERIEVALRTRWIQSITLNYDEWGYLDKSNYSSERVFFSDIGKLGTAYWRNNGDEIKKFRDNNPNTFPPVNIASEVISFGTLSKFINNLKSNRIKQEIARYFEFDSIKIFSSAFHHLNYIRNISAHHGRLWNRHAVIKMIIPKKRPEPLVSSVHLEKNKTESIRIYNTLVLLCHMLRIIAPEAEWKNRMIEFLDTCPLSITEHMGFPEDWKDRSVWKVNE